MSSIIAGILLLLIWKLSCNERFTVLPSSNLKNFYEADEGVVIDDAGLVSEWKNQMGQRNMSQEIGNRCPDYKMGLYNKPMVYFDGKTTKWLNFTGIGDATEFSVFIVLSSILNTGAISQILTSSKWWTTSDLLSIAISKYSTTPVVVLKTDGSQADTPSYFFFTDNTPYIGYFSGKTVNFIYNNYQTIPPTLFTTVPPTPIPTTITPLPFVPSTPCRSSFTITGQVGNNYFLNGIYNVYRSNRMGAAYNYMMMFTKTKNALNPDCAWHTQFNRYDTNQPIASFTITTTYTTVGTTNLYGDWITLKCPHLICMKSYTLEHRTGYEWANRGPQLFYVLGSVNNSTWELIDTQDLASAPTTNELTISTASSTSYYYYFRLVINKLYSKGNPAVNLRSWWIDGVPANTKMAEIDMYFNGLRYNTGYIRDRADTFNLGPLSLGGWEEDPIRTYYGGISSLMLYDKVLADDERKKHESYLSQKWDIPLYKTYTIQDYGVILLDGASNLETKLAIVNTITNGSARTQYISLLNANPDCMMPSDIAVIYNNSNTSRFIILRFNIPSGKYTFTTRLLAPGNFANNILFYIDDYDDWSMTATLTTTSIKGTNIISNYSFTAGDHSIAFVMMSNCAGLVDITISQAEGGYENIYTTFYEIASNPDKVYYMRPATTYAPINYIAGVS